MEITVGPRHDTSTIRLRNLILMPIAGNGWQSEIADESITETESFGIMTLMGMLSL